MERDAESTDVIYSTNYEFWRRGADTKTRLDGTEADGIRGF